MKSKASKAQKSRKVKSIIEDAAEKAALLAAEEDETDSGVTFDEPETDEGMIDLEFNNSTPEEATEIDVFDFSYKKATQKNDVPRFWIHKDSALLCTKDWPYSWDQLQKDYGPGLYKVSARSRKTGVVIKTATEMIGDPTPLGAHESYEDNSQPQTPQMGPMEILATMNQLQEKSEAKAMASSQQQVGMITAMMTAMSQSTQQASQQMQMLMLEMQKQSQSQIQAAQMAAQSSQNQMMTLMTTLLTQKPDNKGADAFTMLKMISDARKEAKDEQSKFFELLDKKVSQAREEAEEMSAGSEKEESLSKSLIKGFIPVLTQVMANQQQAQGQQPTPEQIEAVKLEQNRLMIEQQKRQDYERNLRQQQIAAQKARAVASNVPAPMPTNPIQSNPSQPTVTTTSASVVIPKETKPMESNPQKEKIFEMVKTDLGMALLKREAASQTASRALQKLAKEGISRQTVLNAFALEDLFDLAKQNGVPDIAKPWLEEFYAALQTQDASTTKGHGKPVARTRTPIREPSKTI